MKRSGPVAALIFCGIAVLLPLLSTAVLCSGLIRVGARQSAHKGKGQAAPAPLLAHKKRAQAATA